MAKRKQGAGKAKREAARGGREVLAALIRQKEAVVTDGALQVVIAIASVTSLVTVDTTQEPPVFQPEDLGSLTFDDPQVGMDDNGVAIFKANLKVLLPQIADDIDQIPDRAGLDIGEVARFVQLSLMTA